MEWYGLEVWKIHLTRTEVNPSIHESFQLLPGATDDLLDLLTGTLVLPETIFLPTVETLALGETLTRLTPRLTHLLILLI
jgi:hypothetical protein